MSLILKIGEQYWNCTERSLWKIKQTRAVEKNILNHNFKFKQTLEMDRGYSNIYSLKVSAKSTFSFSSYDMRATAKII